MFDATKIPAQLLLLIVFSLPAVIAADEPEERIVVNGRRFRVPAGCTIELVSNSKQVKRPISCAFDEQGRLYVTDSSGSNENVQVQLKKRPHRVVRLEDADGDGVFDRSTVFADGMMFPEGAMWHDGSLYVAAPPQIWKLTDTDDDGVADQRQVWFDGKTLTGCANDLHGPYLGKDGWIYWCKGAFAKQTYQLDGKDSFETKAAHIFRKRPDGGSVEQVMTGGMDNPVEFVMTDDGERIFNSTFLHHPHDGKRDGVVHAIYGGVYGKAHGVLEGHPRTGPLMPVLADHDASAPSGLMLLTTSHFGKSYRGNLLCSSFNMHKIFRHVLRKEGAMLKTENQDFVVCDDLDFHPTDIIESPDGSLLIVDTGGWYKLCCPTSSLPKPDVLGGIYRVRRQDRSLNDPLGKSIDWSQGEFGKWLGDERPMIRRKALNLAIAQKAVPQLKKLLNHDDAFIRQQAVWTLSSIASQESVAAVRKALKDDSASVRQTAGHVVSAWKDSTAVSDLIAMLNAGNGYNRRVAAEALGRIGDPKAVPFLLDAAGELKTDPRDGTQAADRALEHSLIYALIEINSPDPTRAGLLRRNSFERKVALIALDQMRDGRVAPRTVVKMIQSGDPVVRFAAWWIAKRHPEWAADFHSVFQDGLANDRTSLENAEHLTAFASDPAIQKVVSGEILRRLRNINNDSAELNRDICIRLLETMTSPPVRPVPAVWEAAIQLLLDRHEDRIIELSIELISRLPPKTILLFNRKLLEVARGKDRPAPIRLAALQIAGPGNLNLDNFDLVKQHLGSSHSVHHRGMALKVLERATLTGEQAVSLVETIEQTGPGEIFPLVKRLAREGGDDLGIQVVHHLGSTRIAGSMDPLELEKLLQKFGEKTARDAKPLLEKIKNRKRGDFQRLKRVLSLVPQADERNGQEIFHGTKASCIACHQMGYLGGRIGPSLSRIGGIRSEAELLESLMFPNLSFVRSYEPQLIATVDGLTFQGVIKNETSSFIELVVDAKKTIRIMKSDIESRKIGSKSIMPTGLDQQFSDQELADLIKFLKVSK